MLEEGQSSSSSSSTPDPKVKRKYALLIEAALKIEDEEPDTALELYKQAEALMPNSLTDKIAEIRVKMKGGKSNTTTNTSPPPTHPIPIPSPPPPISEDYTSLPNFSQTDFLQHPLPPPPPPLSTSLSSSSSSPPNGDSSNEELEVFLDQIIDFLQVMGKEDIDEMVVRKDFQLVNYLMSTTVSRPPSEEFANLALKTAQCFMATCELVPAVFSAMVENRVATWLVRWCKYYVVPKVEAAKVEESVTDNDENIVYFLQLLAILCGQQTAPLSAQERELLDDQAFITLMIQFAIHEYEYEEDSDIAFESAVCLFGISSQFPSPTEDPVVFALYGIAEAATLGRFLIHVTNRGVTPKWLQASALSTSRKLFEFSQLQQCECYFYTNDMRVLLDIAVREIINLDEEHTKLRMEYLQLLRAITLHHEYIAKGKYKHDNVVEVVGCVAFQDYDPESASLAQAMFESLVDNNS